MKRERATRLLEDLLHRVTSKEWPLSLIDEVFLFGSYLRGAVEPHDVDVDIEYTSDEQLRQESVGALLSGKDPMGVLRRALVGRSRGIELQYGLRGRVPGIEMLLLWRRGDALDTALTRLHAIAVDPTAGRAPRDAMLPAFDGLDHWVPRPVRELLAGLVDSGAISIERLELRDSDVRDSLAREVVHARWKDGNPLRRAAIAALSYLEARGVSPRQVHLDGRDVEDAHTPYFVGLKCRRVTTLPSCFSEHGGVEWIEIPRPTKSQPLLALRITARDRMVLADRRWWS